MNECDELFLATESRKKKRGSGFRFSSKKVLDHSRLKRLAKARGCEVTSVTKTLSYPSLIPSEVCFSDFHGSAATSCDSLVLVSIDEFEEERKNLGFRVTRAFLGSLTFWAWFLLHLPPHFHILRVQKCKNNPNEVHRL
jgi:hypothetical protein